MVGLFLGELNLSRSEAFGVVEFSFFTLEVELSFLGMELDTVGFAVLVELVGFKTLVWFLADKFDVLVDTFNDLTSLVWFLVDTFTDLTSLVWFLVDTFDGLTSLVWFFLLEKLELLDRKSVV